MTEMIVAVRNGTMSAEQAAAQMMSENSYSTLYAEYRGEELGLEWVNGMAKGPSADEFYARLDAHNAIRAAAQAIDERMSTTIERAPDMVTCDCGCTVPRAQVMNSSTGMCCPDCYDRMSE